MEKIRGKTLKEWKEYCKSDNVPIKTMKYITCLEERIKQLTIPVVSKSVTAKDLKCPKCKKHALMKYIDGKECTSCGYVC